jgi:hypothetical protein
MPDLQQALVGGESRGRLRNAWVLATSTCVHVAILIGVFALGSPRLLATVPPDSIVVQIVRPDEVAKGETGGSDSRSKPAQVKPPPSAAAPKFTSLYPWPVAPAAPPDASDTPAGDYRTFESTEKLSSDELAKFKARLKACWTPPAGAAGVKKLTAALRVAFRIDGTLAGPPELVEATASPFGPALVESAMRSVNQCAPYGFLPADSYDTWKSLSLTFSPDDIVVAAITK